MTPLMNGDSDSVGGDDNSDAGGADALSDYAKL